MSKVNAMERNIAIDSMSKLQCELVIMVVIFNIIGWRFHSSSSVSKMQYFIMARLADAFYACRDSNNKKVENKNHADSGSCTSSFC